MALVALVFIGVFGFALSRHQPAAAGLQQVTERFRSPAPPDAPNPVREAAPPSASPDASSDFPCEEKRIIDGDTIDCGALRVRLASIDSPEMPGHCRSGRQCVDGDPFASKQNLEQLVAAGPVLCRQTDTDRYGRIVALCSVGGRDLSCAQVEGGFAIIRYGELVCPR